MKTHIRIRAWMLTALIVALTAAPLAALAEKSPTVEKAEADGEKVTEKIVTTTTDLKDAEAGDTADITVVIPPKLPAPEPTPLPAPEEAREKETLYLFPSSVYETSANGARQIIKTYTLADGENPYDISRESFVREGWFYELTDIIRTETASATEIEHKETVALGTDVNDTESVLKLFSPTLEVKTEDGFYGLLTLSVSSIRVETAGTKTSSWEKSVTREYPSLPSADTSYVPKEVTDGGRTYTLADVDWRPQNVVTVDYDQGIAETYTAVATYTRTATSTTVTGYTVTADYLGVISRISPESTVYTAYFLGSKISGAATPVPVVPDEPEDESPAHVTSPPPDPEPTPEPSEIEEPPASSETEPSETGTSETEPPETEEPEKSEKGVSALWFTLPLAVLFLAAAAFISRGVYQKIAAKRDGDPRFPFSVFAKREKTGEAAEASVTDDDEDEDEDEDESAMVSVYSVTENADDDGPDDEPVNDEPDDKPDDEPDGEAAAAPQGTTLTPGGDDRKQRTRRLIKEAAYAEKILSNAGVPPEKLQSVLTELFRTSDAKAVLDRWKTAESADGAGDG